MVSKYTHAYLFILCLVVFGCTKRFNCNASHNKFLGNIDFSPEFKTWNIENETDKMTFSKPNGSLEVSNITKINQEPRQLNEYLVCEDINIKPYRAYAYYQYPNLHQLFSKNENDLIISVEPSIDKENNVRTESIYLSFNHDVFGMKGRIPITNASSMQPSEPYGLLFTFSPKKQVGDREFNQIWFLERDNSGIYYNKETGVVALKLGDDFWYRQD